LIHSIKDSGEHNRRVLGLSMLGWGFSVLPMNRRAASKPAYGMANPLDITQRQYSRSFGDSEAGEGFDDGLLHGGLSEVAQVASAVEEGQPFWREHSLHPIQVLRAEQEIV
jgi:hypothetical protein